MAETEPTPNQEITPPTTSRRTVALRNLFLDPNNYRFVDHDDYVLVNPDQIASDDVQRRTTSFLLGDGVEGIRDILTSIKKNGWLPIDQIQVRELSKGKYLVVEGNRRVCALKHLQRRYEENAIDLGGLSPDFFSSVPVVIYEEQNEAQHLVVMGLAHIAGKKKWPPLNQARALRELITKHGWTEEETCQALGLERTPLRLMLGALALSEIYSQSEFGDQMTTAKYSLFSEVIKSPALRDFIEWDRNEYKAGNIANLERLFSWLSRVSHGDDDEDIENNPPSDPPISTSTNVRELSKIINDEAALRELDESRRLSAATFSSSQIVEGRLSQCLQRIGDSVNDLFSHSGRLTAEHLANLEDLQRKMRGLLAARDRQPMILGAAVDRQPVNAIRQSQFANISIESYRRFSKLEVNDLRRINVFVGENNSGKTSLLEAIQLLVCQNDITALLEIAQRRGKMHDEPPPGWLKEQIPIASCISGAFDSIASNVATVDIRNESEGNDLDDKTGYLTSIKVSAAYGGLVQNSITHLFEQRERVTRYTSSHVLCPIVFSSPFVQHDPDFLSSLFAKGVEAGLKGKVVAFIREHLDKEFKDVDQTTARYAQKFTRFLVQHESRPPAIDLGQFGEGLQRIFYIGLLFAYAKDGIVLIDEFESAIHFKLLKSFTRLIQELAVEFNVQVFLTSHSKECLDAFVENPYKIEDIAAYTLRGSDEKTACYRYAGEQLRTLLDGFDIDLRA